MISNKKRGVSDSDTPSSNDQKLNTTHLSMKKLLLSFCFLVLTSFLFAQGQKKEIYKNFPVGAWELTGESPFSVATWFPSLPIKLTSVDKEASNWVTSLPRLSVCPDGRYGTGERECQGSGKKSSRFTLLANPITGRFRKRVSLIIMTFIPR